MQGNLSGKLKISGTIPQKNIFNVQLKNTFTLSEVVLFNQIHCQKLVFPIEAIVSNDRIQILQCNVFWNKENILSLLANTGYSSKSLTKLHLRANISQPFAKIANILPDDFAKSACENVQLQINAQGHLFQKVPDFQIKSALKITDAQISYLDFVKFQMNTTFNYHSNKPFEIKHFKIKIDDRLSLAISPFLCEITPNIKIKMKAKAQIHPDFKELSQANIEQITSDFSFSMFWQNMNLEKLISYLQNQEELMDHFQQNARISTDIQFHGKNVHIQNKKYNALRSSLSLFIANQKIYLKKCNAYLDKEQIANSKAYIDIKNKEFQLHSHMFLTNISSYLSNFTEKTILTGNLKLIAAIKGKIPTNLKHTSLDGSIFLELTNGSILGKTSFEQILFTSNIKTENQKISMLSHLNWDQQQILASKGDFVAGPNLKGRITNDISIPQVEKYLANWENIPEIKTNIHVQNFIDIDTTNNEIFSLRSVQTKNQLMFSNTYFQKYFIPEFKVDSDISWKNQIASIQKLQLF